MDSKSFFFTNSPAWGVFFMFIGDVILGWYPEDFIKIGWCHPISALGYFGNYCISCGIFRLRRSGKKLRILNDHSRLMPFLRSHIFFSFIMLWQFTKLMINWVRFDRIIACCFNISDFVYTRNDHHYFYAFHSFFQNNGLQKVCGIDTLTEV